MTRILAGGCGVADISGSCQVTRKELFSVSRRVAGGRSEAQNQAKHAQLSELAVRMQCDYVYKQGWALPLYSSPRRRRAPA
jgi:hypothetical protein